MIVASNDPNRPVNGKLGKNPKVIDKEKSKHLLDEAAILSGLVSTIEKAECFASQFSQFSDGSFSSSTLYDKIRIDDNLIKEWKITVKIDPGLKKNRRGSIKIEGYMDYSYEDLARLLKLSKVNQ